MTKPLAAPFLAAIVAAALPLAGACATEEPPLETEARPLACAIMTDLAEAVPTLAAKAAKVCCTDANGNPSGGCIPHEHTCSTRQAPWAMLERSIEIEWPVNALAADYTCGSPQNPVECEAPDNDGDGIPDPAPHNPYLSLTAEFFIERIDDQWVRIYERPASAPVGSNIGVVSPTAVDIWSLLNEGEGFASPDCKEFTYGGTLYKKCIAIQRDDSDCVDWEC